MLTVLEELARSSPFGLLCVFVLIYMNKQHDKQIDKMEELFKENVKNIRRAYSETYDRFEKRAGAKGKNSKTNKE